MGVEFTIIFFVFAVIWLIKEFSDPGYQEQVKWKHEVQKRNEEKKVLKKYMEKKLFSDGYREVGYDLCKATKDMCIENVRRRDPVSISRLPDGYFPSENDFPKGLCHDGFFFTMSYCAGIYLFHQEKIIKSDDLIFGEYPDVEENEKVLRWFQSVSRYASMSNKDFEMAVGRKLEDYELINRCDIINMLVPSFYSHAKMFSARAMPSAGRKMICGSGVGEYYPIRFKKNCNQIIYDFYERDTESAARDNKT